MKTNEERPPKSKVSKNPIRLFLFIRVPLIQGLILLLLPLALLSDGITSLVGGIFDIRTWGGMIVATLACSLGTWAARTTAVVILEGAPARFGSALPVWSTGNLYRIWTSFWILASVSIPLTCVGYALRGDGISSGFWWAKAAGFLAGYGLAYAIIALLILLFKTFLWRPVDQDYQTRVLDLPLSWSPSILKKIALPQEQTDIPILAPLQRFQKAMMKMVPEWLQKLRDRFVSLIRKLDRTPRYFDQGRLQSNTIQTRKLS